VAAILKRRALGINLALIEPAHDHYYQPAFTLVGAGVYPLARTRRTEESVTNRRPVDSQCRPDF
jgi:sulfide:quinone oxidoreductase